MGRRRYYDEDAQPYFEIVCDGCGESYVCGDDSCYDWALLRESAEYDGWNAAAPSTRGPHHCPACVRSGPPALSSTDPAATALAPSAGAVAGTSSGAARTVRWTGRRGPVR